MIWGEAQSPEPGSTIATAGKSSAGEVFMASLEGMVMNDLTISRMAQTMEAYDSEIARLEAETGIKLVQPKGNISNDVFAGMLSPMGATTVNVASTYHHYDAEFERLRRERPDIADRIPTSRSIKSVMSQNAKTREDTISDLYSRSGPGGKVAGFGGSMVGAMADPLSLAALPAGVSTNTIRGAIVVGAGVNAGTEAAIQPLVQLNRADLGLNAGLSQGLKNVGFAGLAGGVLGGTFKGLEKGVEKSVRAFDTPDRVMARELNSLVNGWDETGAQLPSRAALVEGYDASPGAQSAYGDYMRDAFQTDLDLEAASPIGSSPANLIAHKSAVEQALTGKRIEVPDIPVQSEILPGGLEAFRPEGLEVDGKRFQFKSGGDAQGVTNRLSDVQEWDPVKAGTILVWEGRDGRAFVADGHQRSGLARRLSQRSPDSEIRLYGKRLREVDGISSDQARAIAAAKNIAEGSGSAVDAAKVFRVSPELIDGSMSLSSTKVKQAQGLMKLDDDAFMMVVNGVIPENYGAIVGSRVPTERQDAIVRLLVDVAPDNAFQAQAIVDQAMTVPVRREVTQSLFGEEEVVSSLFKERAKVLDVALRQLRRNQNVFRMLVNEDAKISGSGQNKLDKIANTKKVQDDAEAEEIIRRLVNSKGDISTALNAAAEAYANGKAITSAVADFVDAVRSRFGSSTADPRGSSTGGAGRGAEVGRPNNGDIESPEFASAVLEGRGDDTVETHDVQIKTLEAGLFDDPDVSRIDIAVGERLDENGDRVAIIKTSDEVELEIKQDANMLERLRGCIT